MAARESAAIAQRLIEACCAKQRIAHGQLSVHADGGSPMTAKSTAQLYVDLGIAQSHSRPHVSNDNPYSEAGFKTIKYRPEMPDRFGSLQDARAVLSPLLGWYNTAHYHTGLALLTPADVHHGRTTAIVTARQVVLDAAHVRHPERFVHGRPVQKSPPPAAWINPPPLDQVEIGQEVAAH